MRWTGEDLRRARVEAGLLQGDVALGAGMPRWRISELERTGHAVSPTFGEQQRLKLAITVLGDLERKKQDFIKSHRPERRPRKQRKLPETSEPQEVEPEPAVP